MSLWLIGAGPMAQEYARVLKGLNVDFEVIGRSAISAKRFYSATGNHVREGGVSSALVASRAPEQAIVSVGVEQLADVAMELIEAGTKRVLLEKPGALNVSQMQVLQQTASRHKADVLIAYNRRFYASTALARNLIAEDGGPTSCIFEFTEWPHTITPMAMAPGVKEAWVLANSSHVIDLAFHLCGFPAEWRAWHGGSLYWHPTAARFCGAGITEQGVYFSYHADWEAPGRWGVEVLTRKRRFIFKPLEQLQVIFLKTTQTIGVELDDQLDKEFKPGLHEQTKAFLGRNDRLLCTVDEQLRHYAIYYEMAGYSQSDSAG